MVTINMYTPANNQIFNLKNYQFNLDKPKFL